MDNSNNLQPDQDQVMTKQIENMYPEVYHDIYPLIVKSVDDIMRSGYMPIDNEMNYHVDNIIKMSGMWDEDEDDAAIYAQSFQRRRHRRRHHNRNTLRDITRILFLRELRDRKRRRF